MVLSMTWLKVLQSFGLSLYPSPSYLVQLCLIGYFFNCHFDIDLFRVLCQSSYSLKYFIRIGPYYLAFIFTLVVLSLMFSLQGSCTS